MTPNHGDVADAIIDDWLKRLPSVAELHASTETEIRNDFGVPAIYLQIVIWTYKRRTLELERSRIVFGHDIHRMATPTEFSRAQAIRAFATNVVDSILCAEAGVTRDQLITSVIARVGLLPLAPVEQGARR